jgi:hypothetical protein
MNISEELRNYIEMVEEEWENDLLFEMANLGSHNHGISNVVIWVGKANKRHGLRIKISNIKDRWSNDDNFVIQIPSLDYDHSRVARWITPNIMKQIFLWIKLNQKLLYDYETDKIIYTDDFIRRISKV